MGGVGYELPLLFPGFFDGAKGPSCEEDVDGEEDGQSPLRRPARGRPRGIPSARRKRNRRTSHRCRLSCFASCRRVRNPTRRPYRQPLERLPALRFLWRLHRRRWWIVREKRRQGFRLAKGGIRLREWWGTLRPFLRPCRPFLRTAPACFLGQGNRTAMCRSDLAGRPAIPQRRLADSILSGLLPSGLLRRLCKWHLRARFAPLGSFVGAR